LLGNRFAKKELEGKNVNIDMEMSKATINDMSVLKELTGVQPVRIEPKHLPAYTTRLWAKLFFSTNEMPEMNDFSDGHYRREVIISFPYQFEEVQAEDKSRIAAIEANAKLGSNIRVADPTLKNTLTTPEELSGIFNALVRPLRRIMLENKPPYSNVRSIEERRKRHEIIADPVKSFLEDAVIYDSEATTYKDTLYNAYRIFCRYHKLHIDSYDSFCKSAKNKMHMILDGAVKEGRDNSEKRRALWKGVQMVKWEVSDASQNVLFTV
jgi:putative DNA primase/helicase